MYYITLSIGTLFYHNRNGLFLIKKNIFKLQLRNTFF